MGEASDAMRLDKWLWVARFFKTRANAAEAVNGGKVHLNGTRVKPARQVKVGDSLRIRRDDFEFDLSIAGLAAHRRPASEAQQLYMETEDSRERRAALAAQRRAERDAGARRPRRPDKHSRRTLSDLKRGSDP